MKIIKYAVPDESSWVIHDPKSYFTIIEQIQ